MFTEHLQCARHLARCWGHRAPRTLQFSRRQQTNEEVQGNVNRSIWAKLEAQEGAINLASANSLSPIRTVPS